MRRFAAREVCFGSLLLFLLSLPLAGQVNLLTAMRLTTGNAPYSLVAADLNGDGRPDLIASNNGDSTVTVFLQSGNGAFQPGVTYNVGKWPYSVAVGDFNGDGKLDLAVADSGAAGTSNQVSVLLGNGDGTFQAEVNYPTSSGTYALVIGDFNGDRKLDIAATDFNGGVDVLLGNGDGTFRAPLTTPTGLFAGFLTAADFNLDGKLDLAVGNVAEGSAWAASPFCSAMETAPTKSPRAIRWQVPWCWAPPISMATEHRYCHCQFCRQRQPVVGVAGQG